MVSARGGYCEVSATVMGTHLVIKAWGDKARQAATDALRAIRRVEGLMSAFRRSSDVSRLNRRAGISPVRISSDTMRVMQYAVEVSRMSSGAFDITAGPLISLWRESISNSILPSPPILDRSTDLVGISSLILQPDTGRACLSRRGQSIDLGGIAKGYAADKAMEVFEKSGLRSGLVDIGGNIAVYGPREDGRPWRVGIQSPDGERGEVLGAVEAVDEAVVTSGDYERFFENAGKRYHHVVDPRTGYPARSGLRSVTVVADRGLAADAVSTAAFVLGLPRGGHFLREAGVDAVLVTGDGDLYVTPGLVGHFIPAKDDVVRTLGGSA